MTEFQRIESRSNHNIKFARSVRDGQEAGSIFIEGKRLAEEALEAALRVRMFFVTPSKLDEMHARIEVIAADGCEVFVLPEKTFEAIADTKNPQGIALIAERPASRRPTVSSAGLAVYLHEVNNPNNLGAVIRSAEAAGAAGLIASVRSADPFSSKALRGAMGSAFRLPIWTNAGGNEVFDWASELGLVPTAIDVSGETSYTDVDWERPRLLMFGSEAHGLPEEILGRSGVEKITIPMAGEVESLNLAVSAAVVMFEARRQQMLKN